ncbi:MAG: hypothetical protein AAB450_00135 [Patescibacteria group bacterium]
MTSNIDISRKIKELEGEMDRIALRHQQKQSDISRIKDGIRDSERALEAEIQKLKQETERDLSRKRRDFQKLEEELKEIEREDKEHNQALDVFNRDLTQALHEQQDKSTIHKKSGLF